MRLSLPPANHLKEEFLWTANDAAALHPTLQAHVRGQNDKVEPHFFRAHFYVTQKPGDATLYLAGPRAATVYVNGRLVLQAEDDPARPKGFHVLTASVASALRAGENSIAMKVVRGHSSLHTDADATINQVTYGEVVLCKIVPRSKGISASPLLVSQDSWRSVLAAPNGWERADFTDTGWPRVQILGIPGTNDDFLQWNADAGLYAWPGYAGISRHMRVFRLKAASIKRSNDGETLDFGREINGRLRIASKTGTPVAITLRYGESREEAESDESYLGQRDVFLPAYGIAYGPKSGFRYVHLRSEPGSLKHLRIEAQGITYPVRFLGWFNSSDATVNRIWETASYTAHLCMQEGIWDGVKRDRARWMGDLDVTGRTIESVFGASSAVEGTMTSILGAAPVTHDINTIPGYSALWITGLAELYRHNGDMNFLVRMRTPLKQLVALLRSEIDADGVFRNRDGRKVFVDWSNGLSADSSEAREATDFEMTLAFDQAAFLLNQLGERDAAADASDEAELMREAARNHASDEDTFGERWQTNAMAVLSGTADAKEREAIWSHVLASVNTDTAGPNHQVITPYYGYYVLSAMADLGHGREALAWMRHYWGGMLDEGATSFWEAYDPGWPKQDFHASLEADGKRGYYVSLAHGWSSGPAAWLLEQVLGIQPIKAGFREVSIAPELDGLRWARGAEPTPRGLIGINVRAEKMTVTLPPGIRATVRLPFPDGVPVEENGRLLPAIHESVVLNRAGGYRFRVVTRGNARTLRHE
ncbi:alpha-L-rhamnosidase C-terminal domain-containing protein [Silvibacterium sp.]|uniref:alpha-L-rhamnosidase-related protein n=1 Tax=Silvibacterium sp. TaxID=1964179 RepID=UPI0039E56E95